VGTVLDAVIMTLYEILGVDKNATQQEIKQAYKDMAKEKHEDKGGSHEDMIEVNRAYMVLRDKVRRDKYDRTGDEEMESFDLKFSQYVQQIFMNIIAQNDVDYKDLIQEFREYNGLMVDDNENKVLECQKQLNKLNKVVKRLSGESGVVLQVVKNNVVNIEREIEGIKDNIKFLRECGECLMSVHYKFDEAPPQQSYEFHGFNFRQA